MSHKQAKEKRAAQVAPALPVSSFTRAELQAVKYWLSVIRFEGGRAELREAFALHDSINAKIDAALNDAALGQNERAGAGDGRPNE